MASKSFTIDHILHGNSSCDHRPVNDYHSKSRVTPQTSPSGPASLHCYEAYPIPYWVADVATYNQALAWPAPNSAPSSIWLQHQQHVQSQHHSAHSSSIPVDLSASTESQHRQAALAPTSFLYNNNSNWVASNAMAAAAVASAMSGCWTSVSPELLGYSHHGMFNCVIIITIIGYCIGYYIVCQCRP